MLPALIRYAARPLAVDDRASDWNHPDSASGIEEAAPQLASGLGTPWFELLAVVTLGWQAYIYAGVIRALPRDDGVDPDRTWRAALPAAFLPAVLVAVLVVAVNGPFFPHGGAGILIGGFFLASGFLALAVAREFIMLNVRMFRIGMRGGEEMEPRAWYVWITWLGGLFFVAAGFFLLDGLTFL